MPAISSPSVFHTMLYEKIESDLGAENKNEKVSNEYPPIPQGGNKTATAAIKKVNITTFFLIDIP